MRQLTITKRITNRESDSIQKYFTEVSKIPLLSDVEELQIAILARNGDEKAILKLVSANLRFVISVAKQYTNRGIAIEDLVNDGNMGLIKAARKFDETRGFKFISYAVWWIRQSILQAISEQSTLIRIPSNQNASNYKIRKTATKLEQSLDREPTDDEIQCVFDDMGIDIKVSECRFVENKVSSFDSPISSGDETMTMLDILPDNSFMSPDSSLNKDSINIDLNKVLKNLPVRHRKIICMYYGILGYTAMNLEDIGIKLNLTRERVRQIKDHALKILKCRKNSGILKQYFNTDIK
jgi:RNA polymerase primary sigma factor